MFCHLVTADPSEYKEINLIDITFEDNLEWINVPKCIG